MNFYISDYTDSQGRRTCNQEQILDEAVKHTKWFSLSTGETQVQGVRLSSIEIMQVVH